MDTEQWKTTLEEVMSDGEIVCINDEWIGFVRMVRDGQFIMELVCDLGRPDGYLCEEVEGVRQIDRDTLDLRRTAFLMKSHTPSPQADTLNIEKLTSDTSIDSVTRLSKLFLLLPANSYRPSRYKIIARTLPAFYLFYINSVY